MALATSIASALASILAKAIASDPLGGGGGAPPPPPPDDAAVDHVTVSPSTFTITEGATQQLTAQAFDASNNPLTKTYTWSSSDPAVATVDAAGLVTGVAAGSATITATTAGISGTSAATIEASVPAGNEPPVAGYTFWTRSDLGLFSDAAKTTAQSTDGGMINAWENQVTGGPDALGDGTTGPTLNTAETFRGLPAVEFTAANVTVLKIAAALFSGVTAGEAFIVTRAKDDPAPDLNHSGFWHFGGTDSASTHPYTNGNIYETFGSSSQDFGVNPSVDLSTWHVYNVYSALNDKKAFINGTEIAALTTNTVAWPPSSPHTEARLGTAGDDAYRFDGFMVEFVFFPFKLTDQERADMTAYLSGT